MFSIYLSFRFFQYFNHYVCWIIYVDFFNVINSVGLVWIDVFIVFEIDLGWLRETWSLC